MGCGSSSLKGDDVPNVNSSPTTTSAPIKKVQTNFSTVDYDQDARGRRMTEYAPDETVKAKKHHDATTASPPPPGRADGPSASIQITADPPERNAGTTGSYLHEGVGSGSDPSRVKADDHLELKPYQTHDGPDWDNDANPSTQATHVNGTRPDPTSSLAKEEFATASDPANPLNQESQHQHQPNSNGYNLSAPANEDGGDRKKSWLGEKYASYQSAKQGRGTQLSDEELKKYTGKDRAELKAWAANTPGVAGNQNAGRSGTDSAAALGSPYTAG